MIGAPPPARSPTHSPCRSRSRAWAGWAVGALLLSQVSDSTAWAVLPMAGIVFVSCAVLPAAPVAGRSLDVALLAFLSVYVLAGIAGHDARHSLMLSAPAIPAVATYLAIARGASKRAITIGIAIAAVWSIGSLLVARKVHPDEMPAWLVADMRLQWFVVPNDVLALVCLYPWMRELVAKLGGTRWEFSTGLGALVFAAAWTLQSRIAMSLTLFVVAMDIVARAGNKRCAGIRAIALLVCALAPMVFIAGPKGFASGFARWELIKEATCLFAANPLLGTGPHTFGEVRSSCASVHLPAIDGRAIPWSHNLYLEIAAEMGLFGVTASLLVAVAFWRLIRTTARSHGLRSILIPTSALITLLLAAFVELTLLRLWVWTATALALGWLRAEQRTPDSVGAHAKNGIEFASVEVGQSGRDEWNPYHVPEHPCGTDQHFQGKPDVALVEQTVKM
jgi:hypothetical protein